MKILKLFSTLLVLMLVGCGTVPHKPPSEELLKAIENFKKPSPGMAGIYVYQWKTGFAGSLYDAVFEIKGKPPIALNTGEYGYMEVPPGNYEFKFSGGLPPHIYLPIEFEADKNYFFRAQIGNLSYTNTPIMESITPMELESAMKNISAGKYEWHDLD